MLTTRSRDIWHRALIEAAKKDPRLSLAVAEATLREPNPIYMRSNLPGTGYIRICDSEKGGGQGDALTGHIYVINQDPALKATEAANWNRRKSHPR